MKKLLNKFESILIYLFPIVIFFSYYPLLRLGENETMNFELSLPLIWLLFFGTLSILKAPNILSNNPVWKTVLIMGFPLYVIASILWSENKLRGILTAGILWLIVMSIINIVNTKFNKMQLQQLLRLFLGASVAVAFFCILQCLLDVIGVSREYTLLCPGCTYNTFGFPHSNGLAIEPQFMGNLLIAPCLTSLYIFYKKITSKKNKKSLFGILFLSVFLILALFICFSRGALYAFWIATIVLVFLLFIKNKQTRSFLLFLPVILGCCGGLLLQGIFSEISPTDENFTQGIQRSIHQVSLGLIDIREKSDSSDNQASFSGYIEESTDIRLGINEIAIGTWLNNNVITGVGIGSGGISMSKYSNTMGAKEIVQNEYINVLLELGLIGVILLAVLAIIVLKKSKILFNKPLVLAISISFLITLCFFSGLPNVLHIYLLVPLIYQLSYVKME